MTDAIDFPTTDDGFLSGRIRLLQPKKGFRAGVDSVFLAAAVPARPGERVLELGTGPGVAAVCLLARVAVALTGIEREGPSAGLARENARRNGFRAEIIEADVTGPLPLEAASFGHVFANPPFFDAAAASLSPHALKARAHAFGAGDMARWVQAAACAVMPGGSFTVINRWEEADAISGMMAAEGFGGVRLLPIAARPDAEPIRAILQGFKGASGAPRRLPYFVLHGEEGHGFTDAANRILREGQALQLSA